jgi:hypothetical protein
MGTRESTNEGAVTIVTRPAFQASIGAYLISSLINSGAHARRVYVPNVASVTIVTDSISPTSHGRN